MRDYAVERVRNLLKGFEAELNRAAESRDADTIHDLRVSNRRLSEALRLFRQFFPPKETKRCRRKLKGLMDLAAALRDKDVALDLLREAGQPDGDIADWIREKRAKADSALRDQVLRWQKKEMPAQFSKALEISE